MPSAGKIVRLNRFYLPDTQVAVIAPVDHGLTLGPIDGLENIAAISRWIRTPGITGIIAHKGMIDRLAGRHLLSGLGVMVHLNGMTASGVEPNRKELVTEIETALRLGADAVSIQLNFDGSNDSHNLTLLGRVVDQAMRFDLPVMPMVYDVCPAAGSDRSLARLRHLMRVAVELGADALKVAAPSSLSDVRVLLADLSADIPIFLAGGARGTAPRVLEVLREALRWGGRGLCMGRNLFQSDAPESLLREIRDIIRTAPVPKSRPDVAIPGFERLLEVAQ
jgi:class I fructose-bisphosphate aldolase/fructose-bisphosphate aldolase/2-amino-3,7-dideoxy-D-threo-hept-6-ulosonate synthase